MIYRQAFRVVIWLGPASETSDLGIEFALGLHEALTVHIGEYRSSDRPVLSHHLGKKLWPSNFRFPPSEAQEWIALANILGRDWFQRLWIVQEAFLNQNTVFQCGTDEFAWKYLGGLNQLLQTQPFLKSIICRQSQAAASISLLGMIDGIKLRKGAITIEDFIMNFTTQQATDARDFIYTLLSLGPLEAEHLDINYRLSVSEVYMQFARTVLGHFQRDNILYSAILDSDPEIKLPSRAPNWKQLHLKQSEISPNMAQAFFRASRHESSEFSFSQDGRTLHIKGRRVSQLDHEGVRAPEIDYSEIWKNHTANEAKLQMDLLDFLSKARQLADSCDGYPPCHSKDRILAQTFCREQYRMEYGELPLDHKNPIDAAENAIQDYAQIVQAAHQEWIQMTAIPRERVYQQSAVSLWKDRWWKLTHTPSPTWIFKGHAFLVKAVAAFNEIHGSQLRGNRITKTENGLLASVPKQCNVGDIVVIFYGWDTPFVLRAVESGYLLVGQCYVNGLMKGEAYSKSMGPEIVFDIK